jgi:hypothetical protein
MPEALELVEHHLGNGVSIPSIAEYCFCSRRDPVREAELWLQRQKISGPVLVLGLGAGFHIQALPVELEIHVIELRPALVERWQRINKRLLKIHDPKIDFCGEILEFRPAWSGLEIQYQEISNNLRGLNRQGLQTKAEAQDLWILSEALRKSELPENYEITIKDIVNLIPIENQSEEARLWRALRELVA